MVKIIYKKNVKPSRVSDVITTINDDTTLNLVIVPEHFDYVYNRFETYNPDIDSSTVILFNEVCTNYRLDTVPSLLEWCVGQILLESGAKQYYHKGHPKEGRMVRSSAGAIGFTQIMPNTAYGYLTKYVTVDEFRVMSELGATSIDFVDDENLTENDIRVASKDWVELECNNIILWGYMMRRKLDKLGPIEQVLVSYNSGTAGMYKFLKNGGNLYKHKYIRGIKSKLKYAENNLVSSI